MSRAMSRMIERLPRRGWFPALLAGGATALTLVVVMGLAVRSTGVEPDDLTAGVPFLIWGGAMLVGGMVVARVRRTHR